MVSVPTTAAAVGEISDIPAWPGLYRTVCGPPLSSESGGGGGAWEAVTLCTSFHKAFLIWRGV